MSKITFAAAVVVAIAADPALAQFAPPTTTVDVGKEYSVLQPILMTVGAAAASVITAVIAWVGTLAAAWLKKKLNLTDAEADKLGLEIDAKHREALQTALTNAAGLALNKLGNDLKGRTVDVRSEAVAGAIDTVFKSAPDAVAYFGLQNKPSLIAEKIVAKLPQVANTTAAAPAASA